MPEGKAAVIGLDGVGLGLARALVEAGVMPNLGAFLRGASVAPILSTIPTVSSVSWASFVSGCNPGKHGIYGFTDIDPVQFKQYFTNMRHLTGPTLWSMVGDAGLQVVIVNVPGTYPAPTVRGVLISGFVAVDLAKSVYPPSLLAALQRADYRVDVDYARADERADAFFGDLQATLAARRRVLLDLVKSQPWNLFVGVVTETDRLHHYFWHAWMDHGSPFHERFVEFYRSLDTCIGDLLDALGDVPVVVMADHGHTRIEQEFFVNAWLREHGYLVCDPVRVRTVADIEPASKAFALDPGRIYLNLRGRFPTGSVAADEGARLLDEIADGLAAVRWNGRAPVASVLRREELYHGPCAGRAPDAVVHFTPGFDLRGSLRAREAFGRSALTGMHSYDDALFACNRSGLDLTDLRIIDVAPSLMSALRLAVPADIDGTDRGITAS